MPISLTFIHLTRIILSDTNYYYGFSGLGLLFWGGLFRVGLALELSDLRVLSKYRTDKQFTSVMHRKDVRWLKAA
jgi:hypothetical protein